MLVLSCILSKELKTLIFITLYRNKLHIAKFVSSLFSLEKLDEKIKNVAAETSSALTFVCMWERDEQQIEGFIYIQNTEAAGGNLLKVRTLTMLAP